MAYLGYNLLVLVVYLSVVHSFPVAVPAVPTTEPVVPTAEPVMEPAVPSAEPTAKPNHIAVSKAVSKGRTIPSLLLRHKKW